MTDVFADIVATAAGVIALGSLAWAIVASVRAGHAAERATVATEKMAGIQLATFDRPPWTLTWFGGDTFLLTNNSALDAHDVRVDGDPADVTLNLGKELPWEVGAMSAEKFMFAATLGHGVNRDIVVRWRRDGSDKDLTWRHPIPAKPRT